MGEGRPSSNISVSATWKRAKPGPLIGRLLFFPSSQRLDIRRKELAVISENNQKSRSHTTLASRIIPFHARSASGGTNLDVRGQPLGLIRIVFLPSRYFRGIYDLLIAYSRLFFRLISPPETKRGEIGGISFYRG